MTGIRFVYYDAQSPEEFALSLVRRGEGRFAVEEFHTGRRGLGLSIAIALPL